MIAFKILETVLTLAAAVVLFIYAYNAYLPGWLGFAIGFVGAGVILDRLESIWRKR